VSVMDTGRSRDAVPVVELCIVGRLDVKCLPAVRAAMYAAVDLRPDVLVIDLAGCCGIDAAAIALLLDVHRDLLRAGSALTLRAPSPRLRRILAIARVANVLHIIPQGAPPDHGGAQDGSAAGGTAAAGGGAAAVTTQFVVAGTDSA
jgi:anti-anti-sigma factor